MSQSTSPKPKHIVYNGDLYEIVAIGVTIVSITLYPSNMQAKGQPVDFNELQPEVQNRITNKLLDSRNG